MSASAPASAARVRRSRAERARARALARVLVVSGGIAVAVLGLGIAYAGSPATLAKGVSVAGLDVGGLTTAQARAVLEQRAEQLDGVPVTFVAAGTRWQLTPAQLGVEADWGAAVVSAQQEGEGFAPVRGLRRLQTRFFGAEVAPPTRVFEPALAYAVNRIARTVNASPVEARVRLRGLRPVIVPGRAGGRLDRAAAELAIVRALAGLRRAPVTLPVRTEQPRVAAGELTSALAQTRVAVTAPVRLRLGPTRWRVPRWRIATLLSLPANGRTELRVGGPAATRWLGALGRRVNRRAKDADFAVRANGTVDVVPAATGLKLNAAGTAHSLLQGALSRTNRNARVVVATSYPERSTAEARSMGVTRQVAAYTTLYGGEANRLHNVRLVAQLTDKALIAPGAVFSFNGTTGERTEEKGFLEAPVIINGELQNGLGGGVCQVSTTVYNAAYEAGLPIEERTNHALYIDHYPLGRDATVNYPDLDLKFRNDTGKWLLLRTWVGESSLTVALYGTPPGRRVETEESPLLVTGPPTEKRVADPELYVGETALDDAGEPSRSTRVRRLVYSSGDKLLHDTTWTSSYRSEPRIVRYGTKARPAPPPPPPEPKKDPPAGKQPTPPTDPEPTSPKPQTTTPATPEIP